MKEDIDLAVIQTDIKYIKKSIDDLSDKIDDNYVTRKEFEPVRNIAYGLVALLLTTVVGAIIALVLK